MTHSQRLALSVVLLLFAAAPRLAGAEHHEESAQAEPPVIQVVSTMVGGKNVFIPATLVVAAGRPHVLSIFNTTDVPHGFAIPDLGIEVVLPPKEEFEVQLPALPGEAIHAVHCHLHPPHRNAQLVVIETDDDD